MIQINYAQVETLLSSYRTGIASLVQQAQQQAAGRQATLTQAGSGLMQSATDSGTPPGTTRAEQSVAEQAQQKARVIAQADVPIRPVPAGQAGAQPSTPDASGMDDPDRQRASHVFNN